MKQRFSAFNYSFQPTITASGKKTVDIYIDGQIIDAESQQIYKEWFGDTTSVSYKSFRNDLQAEDADVYNIYINSGGGLVTDAMAMHDLLRDMQKKGKTVNVEGRGIIASAATFILMASDSPKMSSNSWLMIHNVSGFAYGTVQEVEQQAKVMRQFNDRVNKFYQEKTGLSMDTLNEMMNAETWMTAEDAKQKGFIAEISGEATISNVIRKENWLFNNTAVLNAYNQQVSAPPTTNNIYQQQLDEMKKFWQDFKAGILNAVGAPQATAAAATENTASVDAATPAPDNAAPVAPTANMAAIFDQFEQRFEQEASTLVTNQVNEHINKLGENEAFKTAVTNAVNAHIQTLNLATTTEVEQVSSTVATLEEQTRGAASADTTSTTNKGKKALTGARWE
jgi:ATP-dependent Clp protease protease subunit